MEFILHCESCGKKMKLDEKEYEKHIKKYHPKMINRKDQFYNCSIRRIL